MIKKRVLVLAFELLSLLIIIRVSAHAVGYSVDVLDGATPVIDGEMAPGEWNDATPLSFNFTIVHLKHDSNNLYIAFNISDATLDSDFEGAYIGLDTSNDGGPSFNQSDDLVIGAYRNGTAFETEGTVPLPPGPGWNVSVFEEATGYTIEFNVTYGRIGVKAGENKTLGLLLLSFDMSTFQYSIWPVMGGLETMIPSNWGDMMVVFQIVPIYIKPDGSIEGTDKIESMDNTTYAFTSDINAPIVVQRNNILIDGEGWTLNGVDFTIWEGFNLTGVSNVTIIDVNIERFASYSVYLNSASECVISRNTVMGSEGGIGLFSSNGNMISDNEISGCSEAVELVSSSGNVVSGNNMSDSSSGVYLIRSTSNVVSGNRMTANSRGMYLASANFSAITGNKITANTNDGISLYISAGNSISENDVMNNSGGIVLAASTNNSIAGNTVTGNIAGIRAHGALVNSAYVGSMNNTIIGNNVVHNTNGVDVVGVFFTTISRNYIAENSQYGITLDNANNNTISANNIADNNLGIYYDGLCNNNTAYHNNFFGNAKHVEVSPGDIDAWDDGVEGNYWSNYTGADLNHDGVGDSWHEIYENNTDRHPLMGPFHSFNTTLSKHVNVISNSTIESFQYFESNSTAIMLVSNMTASQTHGFCRISLPYEVMSGPYNVTIDGALPTYWNYSIYDNGTHKWIYFEYEHSTLKIIIVPEFPSLFILSLFMTATLLVASTYRRKHNLKT